MMSMGTLESFSDWHGLELIQLVGKWPFILKKELLVSNSNMLGLDYFLAFSSLVISNVWDLNFLKEIRQMLLAIQW